jgi:hypothetical protein
MFSTSDPDNIWCVAAYSQFPVYLQCDGVLVRARTLTALKTVLERFFRDSISDVTVSWDDPVRCHSSGC